MSNINMRVYVLISCLSHLMTANGTPSHS